MDFSDRVPAEIKIAAVVIALLFAALVLAIIF